MEFTFTFIKLFLYGLGLASPLLVSLLLLIIILSQIVSSRESWNRLDAIYWAFITATTVGYGDMRPIMPASKVLSILIALTGMVFTGIMVALAIHAATTAFSSINDIADVKAHIQKLQ